MRFTKYNSMRDILSWPGMQKYLRVFFSEDLLSLFPEEYEDRPIAYVEQVAKTPWGDPFSVIADQLMDALGTILDIVDSKRLVCIPLWNPDGKCWTPEEDRLGGEHRVFLLAPVIEPSMAKEKKPAVLICPGGGYEAVCFSGEGNPVRYFMEANGYRTFVLRYRVYPQSGGQEKDSNAQRYPDPQKDLTLAIMYLRAHAEEYGIDPEDLMLFGASAGAHLCALEAALYSTYEPMVREDIVLRMPQEASRYESVGARPDKLCLCYPVISFEQEPHEGSFQALTGGREELRCALSVERLVTGEYPKTFIWTVADDDCVPPSNTLHMAESLEKHNVPYQMRVYRSGGHGCYLAFCKEARDWSNDMLEFMKNQKEM